MSLDEKIETLVSHLEKGKLWEWAEEFVESIMHRPFLTEKQKAIVSKLLLEVEQAEKDRKLLELLSKCKMWRLHKTFIDEMYLRLFNEKRPLTEKQRQYVLHIKERYKKEVERVMKEDKNYLDKYMGD